MYKNQSDLKKILYVFAFVLFACFAQGCKDNDRDDVQTENIAYGTHPSQKLDIILPSDISADEQIPAVFCIHGGSWSAGDKKDFDWVAPLITGQRCAYVTINYRLLQEGVTYKQMLDDIDAAITFLKKNNSSYNLRTDKMCIVGASAGAHLGLLYAYGKESPIPLSFVVSLVGPADFTDPSQITHSGDALLELINSLTGTQVKSDELENTNFPFPDEWYDASPIHHIKSTSPPTILAYGEKDILVSYTNALRLNDTLQKHNVEHQLISFPNSSHELEDDPDKTMELTQLLLQYVQKYLK